MFLINWYKSYVLWSCRVMQRIPGYRKYGRFLERHYTKHFWTTWLVMMGSSIAINRLIHRWLTKALDKGVSKPTTDQAVNDLFTRIMQPNGPATVRDMAGVEREYDPSMCKTFNTQYGPVLVQAENAEQYAQMMATDDITELAGWEQMVRVVNHPNN